MRKIFVTAANRCFFPGAEALLKGALRHHPDVPRFCYVAAEEQDEARGRFGQLAEILVAPRPVVGIPEAMQCYVPKLFAPTLDADVMAYVDSDAILCRPIPELWEVPPGKVNVVRDGAPNVIQSVPPTLRPAFAACYPDQLDIPCFNGGVWALRCSEFRDLVERYEAELARVRFPEYHPILDQPMLNVMWQARVNWLPFRCNVNNLFDHRIPRDAKIVHFTGGQCKPWDPKYPRHEPQYYWWLKYGLNERDPIRLALAKLRVWVTTPKRLIGRRFRRWQAARAAL